MDEQNKSNQDDKIDFTSVNKLPVQDNVSCVSDDEAIASGTSDIQATISRTIPANNIGTVSSNKTVSTSLLDSIYIGVIGTFTSAYLYSAFSARQDTTRPTEGFQQFLNYEDYKTASKNLKDAIQQCPDRVILDAMKSCYYLKLRKENDASTVNDADAGNITSGYICLAMCDIALDYIMVKAGEAVKKESNLVDENDKESSGVQDIQHLVLLWLESKIQAEMSLRNYATDVSINKIKNIKVNSLAMLTQIEQALEIAREYLQSELKDYYALELWHYFSQKLLLSDLKAGVFPFHLKAIDSLQKANEIIHFANKADLWQDACYKLEQAIKADKNVVNILKRVLCNKAETYQQSNEIYKSIEEYTEVLQLDNNCDEVLSARAKCYAEINEYESAIKDYEKLLTITNSEKLKRSTQNSIITLKKKKTLFKNQNVKSQAEALSQCKDLKQGDEDDISEKDALFAKGRRLYIFENQYQEALDYLEQVLRVDPSHSGALALTKLITQLKITMEQANDSLRNGRWQDALDKFNEALTIDKDNTNLKVIICPKKAKIYFSLKQIDQAIEAYTDALKLDEKCLNALRGRAECYIEVEKYNAAVKDYENILLISPSEYITQWALRSIDTLKKKIEYSDKCRLAESLLKCQKTVELEQALNLAEECLQFNRSDKNALCVKGSCLYYKGQYQEALNQFQQVLDFEPSHSMALGETIKITLLKNTITKGNNAFIAGRLQDALAHFKEVIKIDSDNLNLKIKMHCKNAEIYLKSDKIYRAIKEYTSAIEIDEYCAEALRSRADCYWKIEDYKNAFIDYSKICQCEADEETKQWANNFKNKISNRKKCKEADILVKSQKTNNIEQALKIATECLQFDSSDIEALYLKGSCLYYKNQYEEAIDQFRKVWLLKPLHSQALKEIKRISLLKSTIELGTEFYKKGQLRNALKKFNMASTLDKDNMNLNVDLNCKKAAIYFKLKQIQEAIEAYTVAIQLNEECVEALLGRAGCYTEAERYYDAVEDYEKILSPSVKCEETKRLARYYNMNLNKKIDNKNKRDQAEVLIQSRNKTKLEQATKLIDECLQFDNSDVKALCLKGFCLYYKNDLEQALSQFRKITSFEPQHSTALKEIEKITNLKCKIKQGENLITSHQWHDALIKFNEALTIDKDNMNLKASLYCKIADVYTKLNHIQRAIEEYTNALVLADINCIKCEALRRRASCFTDARQYEDALKDYEKLYTFDKRKEIEVFIAKTKAKLENQRLSQLKAQSGNTFYKLNKFTAALEMYKEAIQLYPYNAAYYGNTFSCYTKLSMSKEALVDAQKAVELDVNSSKGVGVAKCYIALGDLSGAERAVTKASEAGEQCEEERRALQALQKLHAQAHKHIEERNYERAVSCMDQCLESSPFSSKVKLIKAECLAKLGKIDQAQEIADECIRCDRSDIEALYVNGLCIYYNKQHNQARDCFKKILLLSPEHKKAMAAYKNVKFLIQTNEQVVEEIKMCRWQKVLDLCNEALAIDTTHVKVNAELHFNKATAYARLNETQAAAEACTAALDLDHDYVKALALRAKCFSALQEYECAVDDYERLYRLDPGDHHKKLLDDAKRTKMEKEECITYYDILGVDRNATDDEIKKAYKTLALAHHPDRHSARSLHERKRQERRFKLVLEAYNVLIDKSKRLRYDVFGRTNKTKDNM